MGTVWAVEAALCRASLSRGRAGKGHSAQVAHGGRRVLGVGSSGV